MKARPSIKRKGRRKKKTRKKHHTVAEEVKSTEWTLRIKVAQILSLGDIQMGINLGKNVS